MFCSCCAGGNKGAATALAAWRTRRGVALDISALPGVELLSAKVCNSVQLIISTLVCLCCTTVRHHWCWLPDCVARATGLGQLAKP